MRSVLLGCSILASACGGGAREAIFSLPATVNRFVGVSSEKLLADEVGLLFSTSARVDNLYWDGAVTTLPLYQPEQNTLGNVRLLARKAASGPWVVTDAGIFYYDGLLLKSPLSTAFPNGVESMAQMASGPTVLLRDGTLYFSRGDSLFRFAMSGFDSQSKLMPGDDSVFVMKQGQVLQIVADGPSIRSTAGVDFAWVEAASGIVLTADGSGVYRLTEAGMALQATALNIDDRATLAALKSARLRASGPNAIFFLSDKNLMRVDSAGLQRWQVGEVDLSRVTAIAADPQGGVWLVEPERTHFVYVEPTVHLLGIRSGQSVFETLHVRVEPSEAVNIRTVEFSVGAHRETQREPPFDIGGRTTDGTPRGVSVANLPEGETELSVKVEYTNGVSLARHVPFRVQRVVPGKPTYLTHIEPLYRSRCARCHVAGGTAFDLDGKDRWKSLLPSIVEQVEQQKMPTDKPLPPELIDLVKRWQAEGAP